MKIDFKFLRWWLSIFLVFCASTAFAVNVTVNGSNLKNQANPAIAILQDTGFVQFIKGTKNPPMPNHGLSGGNTVATCIGVPIQGLVGRDPILPDDAYGNGTFYYSNSNTDVANGNSFYLRYWVEGDNYYGTSVNTETITDISAKAEFVMNFDSFNLYKAAAPYPLDITSVIQKESFDKELYPQPLKDLVGTSSLTVNFSNGKTDPVGADKPVEVVGYKVRIAKSQADLPLDPITNPNDVKGSGGGGTSYTFDLKDAFFEVKDALGQKVTYYTQATAINHFGETSSLIHSFQLVEIQDSITPSAQYTMTWDLKKLSGGTGINTLAIPFKLELDKPIVHGAGSSNGVSIDLNNNGITVQELIQAINTQSGEKIVTVFGWYDAAVQKHIGLTSIVYNGDSIDTAKCTFTGAASAQVILDTKIKQAEPYQVSVNKEKTFKLKGY